MTFILNRIKTDFHKAYDSIKLPEVEETFDIYFSRFFGYYFALIGKRLSMTPNQISIISLLVGALAGYFFYFQEDVVMILWACFFITLSGLLDSADGQLARMTKQSSDIGRVLDGTIDTVVFIACYFGACIYFLEHGYGLWIFPIAIIAGYAHSAKSCVYEYYKAEFVYYVNADSGSRIAYLDEMKKPENKGFIYLVLYYLELDYMRKQTMFHGRERTHREKFEQYTFGVQGQKFSELYRKTNESIMTWWALVCGTNVHRTVMMVTSLFGRMDWYFYFSIVTFFPLFAVVKWQKRLDKNLLAKFESNYAGVKA